MSVTNPVSKLFNLNPSQILGHVVSWTVPAGVVPLKKIREALTDADLPASLAGTLTNEQAFVRGLAKLRSGRAIDKLAQSTTEFQVHDKVVKPDAVEYSPHCLLCIDSNGVVHSDDATIESEATAAYLIAQETRTASDITRIIQRLFEKNAGLFPLNAKGVAYFVPGTHADFTAKVQKFVAGVGGVFTKFPVPDADLESKKNVSDIVSAGINELVDELDQAVESWTADTRESTSKRANDRLDTLTLKCEAYADYLGAKAQVVRNRIASSKKALRDKVQALFDANDIFVHTDAPQVEVEADASAF